MKSNPNPTNFHTMNLYFGLQKRIYLGVVSKNLQIQIQFRLGKVLNTSFKGLGTSFC